MKDQSENYMLVTCYIFTKTKEIEQKKKKKQYQVQL